MIEVICPDCYHGYIGLSICPRCGSDGTATGVLRITVEDFMLFYREAVRQGIIMEKEIK